MEFLKIKDLHVRVGKKEILKGINLSVKKGEKVALLGPNASGKSTLAYSIMGLPEFKVAKGKIFFKGKDITKLKPFERSKLGIALAFQHPPQIKNVKFKDLLERISKKDFDITTIGLDCFEKLLERDVNVGFSGGERKIAELIQLIALKPQLIILDEIDASLDIQKLKIVSGLIKKYFVNDEVSLILITHQGTILKWIKPDKVAVMLDGKIVCESNDWKVVWKTIKRYGYEKCRECKVFPSRP